MGRWRRRRATHRTFKGPTQTRGDQAVELAQDSHQWTFTHWAPERRANPGGHEGKRATSLHPPPRPADVSAAWDLDS